MQDGAGFPSLGSCNGGREIEFLELTWDGFPSLGSCNGDREIEFLELTWDGFGESLQNLVVVISDEAKMGLTVI